MLHSAAFRGVIRYCPASPFFASRLRVPSRVLARFNRINLSDSFDQVKPLCKNLSLSYRVQIFSFFLFCPIANRIRLCHKQYNGNTNKEEQKCLRLFT
jgi:hypothetical protein